MPEPPRNADLVRQLNEMRQTMKSQAKTIDWLRAQMRFECERRDAEIEGYKALSERLGNEAADAKAALRAHIDGDDV